MTCLWFLSLLAYGLTILEGVNGWTYNYSDTNMTYDEAEQWCKMFHTNLVAIQNKSENDYLNETLPFNPGYYWIGIRKINGNWTWVGTNETLGKDDGNWANYEPNGEGKNEDCVEIYIKRRIDGGKWNDEKCDKKKVALCYRASCNESTCSGNGKCNETINNYTCDCKDGFYGRNCELAVTCPALTPIAHGSVNCSDPSVNVTWGTNCTFTCEEGFVLKGPATLQCGPSGNWTEEQPSCEAVTCPSLTPIAHGSVNCSDPSVNVTWGTNCTFTCEEGFVLKGPARLQCGSSGKWTEEQPSCEVVTCPALTPIAHGSVNCSDPSVNVTWGTNCTFTCEEGFVLKGPATLQCGSSGKWTEEQPSCEAVTCPSLTPIAHGSVNCSDPSVNVTWGTNCTFTCEEGFVLKGPARLQCGSSGNWTEEQPSCEVVTCPALTPIAHGSVNCSDPSVNVTWGTNCTFTCEEGFVLKGPATLQCGSSGKWTEEQPSCEAVTCPSLTPIAHGSVNCSDPSVNVTWGTNCTFTCEEGFVLKGPATLQCGSSGKWTEEQPSCEAVTCPSLTPIAHGSVNCSDPSVNVTWGTNCTFTCEEGFVLKGPATLQCGSSGKWTEEQPSCEVVTCPALTPIAHGSVNCSDPSVNVTWGTNCTFTCEEGFVLKGPATLQCGSSGKWTEEQPSCEAVTCPSLTPIAHGSVNCSDPSVNVTWGTNCTFTCEEGFVLKGPATLQCGSSGKWTEEQPSCEVVTCPALTPIAHGSVNCSDPSVNVTWGTNCTFTCEEGFVLKGPATLQCGSSGKWTEEQPSCEAVTCPSLTPIAHGSVNCSDPSVNVTWGTNCTFTCEEGFVLKGPATLQCGSSGKWTEEQPSCEVVTCPALTPIAHGSVNCSDPSVNVTWGTNCTFTCEEGFVLKGPARLQCGSSGKWTEEQPSCEVVQCEALTRPEKGSMVCSPDTRNFTYNTSCLFACSEGWKLRGSHVLKCSSSGNWSASPPTCEASGQAKQVNYVSAGLIATSASVLTAASFFLWLARRLRKKAKKFTPSSSCQSLTIEGSFQHAGKMV